MGVSICNFSENIRPFALPQPVCRDVLGIYAEESLEDVVRDFIGGLFLGMFPTTTKTNKSGVKIRKNLAARKQKSPKNPFCPKHNLT